MYYHLINYLLDNECDDLAKDVQNETNTEYMKGFIEEQLSDPEVLQDFDTDLIHDMFIYYIKH